MNNLIEIYKKVISSHDIISFDIFDTLLKRNVKNPHDIFSLVEQEFNKKYSCADSHFKEKRIEAEHTARKLSNKEDISIYEIYEQLPYNQEQRNFLLATELRLEKDFLIANLPVKELYEYALRLKKEVIITSDMYLPRKFIESLLESNGYAEYNELYLSSEIGLLKATGNLFKYIKQNESYKGKKILHIGDAKRGDWMQPFLNGIHIAPIKRFYDNTIYATYMHKKTDINSNILYSFINNTSCNIDNRYIKIGYETMGPLLYGFCHWLNARKSQLGIKKLLFFSRDGLIMHKAYQLLYPNDETAYVYVSRRSLLVPIFWTMSSIDEIFSIIPFNRYVSINTIIDKLGLNHGLYQEQIRQFSLNPTTTYLTNDILHDSRFISFIESIKDEIINNSKQEYDAFKIYIEQLGLTSPIGIVDIGWKGTMQYAFERLIKELNHAIDINGFYIGISKKAFNFHGFIYDAEDKSLEDVLRSFIGLFEMLFSANHGSVEKYYNNGQVKLFDFEFELNDKTKEDYQAIKYIQQGALLFIEKLKASPIEKYIKWNKSLSFLNISTLGTYPHKKDLKEISEWNFFDTILTPLAHPHFVKLFSLKTFKQDFSSSAWKIAYLRKLFKIPLPYFKIYTFLRHKFPTQ